MLVFFAALLAFALNGTVIQSASSDDIYAAGRIVTPNGVQESFQVVLGGARQNSDRVFWIALSRV